MSKNHVFISEYCVFRNEMYNLSMDMNQAVAKAIAAERAIAGLTVRQLSAVSGVPVSSLMRILGAEREIKVTQLEQLATAFGITPVDILIRAQEIRERSEVMREAEERLNTPSASVVPLVPAPDVPDSSEAPGALDFSLMAANTVPEAEYERIMARKRFFDDLGEGVDYDPDGWAD